MNEEKFISLCEHLLNIAPLIPLNWGNIQNDRDDGLVNVFTKATLQELEDASAILPTAKQKYLMRRWFLWRCSQCDEYLFYSHLKSKKNPNHKDQNWDIELLGHKQLRFDIKSTILPKKFRKESNKLPPTEDLVKYYFEKQSRGIRNHIQNRIFLVHLPYSEANSNSIRTRFKEKQKGVSEFIYDLSQGELHKLIDFKNCLNAVIYFKEDNRGLLSYKF